ncbi:hypothetical protein NDU88_001746 [Pleurodeles waltl]|uniref:Uncharacterized protein n=1 Tax=Pleurodeles waltl TaxID=8319 RepID=A0AAV7VZU2_PLEWA|nr:hypothetical protein NDU88_001746 [Pleurodeles waltl]
MDQTVDARTEEIEALTRCVATLEDGYRDLQHKHEDLVNSFQRNNIRIRGVPKVIDGSNIMSFVTGLLHAIHGDPDSSPPMLDRAH